MKTFNYNEYKINSLEKDTKVSKKLAIVSGTVLSLAAIVVGGNLAIDNNLVALQNTGTMIAMGGYTIGYLKKAKLNNIEATRLKNKTDVQITAKDQLLELKEKIEETKNSLLMSSTAGLGFGISTLANIALVDEGSYAAIGAMLLTGTISILDILLAFQQSKRLKAEKNRYELLEDLETLSKEPIPELIESKEDERRLIK